MATTASLNTFESIDLTSPKMGPGSPRSPSNALSMSSKLLISESRSASLSDEGIFEYSEASSSPDLSNDAFQEVPAPLRLSNKRKACDDEDESASILPRRKHSRFCTPTRSPVLSKQAGLGFRLPIFKETVTVTLRNYRAPSADSTGSRRRFVSSYSELTDSEPEDDTFGDDSEAGDSDYATTPEREVPSLSSQHTQVQQTKAKRPPVARPVAAKPQPKQAHSSGKKQKQCACCGTTSTPLWRDIGHKLPLCNACGIRWKKYGLICPSCQYVPCKQERDSKHCRRCGSKFPSAKHLKATLSKK